ncbi:hypothetical protein COC42_12110 [Sphingomonas spermidinifaciens]|uniref:DUF11 domain-containing protein n=1 Tax=Sphingomonas spermidinifaciens TaxID=1141889 RepID=A0A2A4B339_9SPHN|nr:DUF11 domain-containing protein [Sphingomonas spermidinifaciens]PCD02199.1 hypothetical protein COC42_12110 [Sphingomonas spermidinifaciens]
MNRTSIRLAALGVCALCALAANPAAAQQTAAGTTITNNVQVNYQVGGVAQTQVTASDTFTVDRKVNLVVTEVGSTATSVSPGQLAAVTTFQVTNSSNAVLDFALAATQQAGGTGAFGGTDNFDASNLRIYVDANGNGTWDATDTLVTYLDELAADTSRTVFVLADMPLGRATGDIAAITLTATAREGAGAAALGAALVQTTTANTSGVDTVFADGAGATDAARDAAFSAKDNYQVLAALLSVLKSSRVIEDPFNGTNAPKLIPGATVEYCIAVSNAAGGAPATMIAVGDVLPTATTYLAAFGTRINGTVTSGTCNADGTAGGTFAAGAVNATLATVTPGETRTVVFRVTIN